MDLFTNIFQNISNENIENIFVINEGIENSALINTTKNKYVRKYHKNKYYNSPDSFLAGQKLSKIVRNNSNIPVPKIIDYNKSKEHTYYLMEYIDGFHYDIDNNTYELQKNTISYLGQYLAELHNINPNLDKYGWLGYDDTTDKLYIHKSYDYFDELMCDLFTEFNTSIKNGGKFNESDTKNKRFSDCHNKISDITTYIKNNIKIETQSKYCHGDYKYNNILLNNNQQNPINAIIDWDGPMLSDPLFNIIKSEWNLIMKYNIHKKLSINQQKELRNTYRTEYIKHRNSKISFNMRHIYVYNLYVFLTCMNNFGHWYENFDEPKKEKTEQYLREKINVIYNYFIN
jgi:aminoglycoside phosphotransferase (APT) family kinase protein